MAMQLMLVLFDTATDEEVWTRIEACPPDVDADSVLEHVRDRFGPELGEVYDAEAGGAVAIGWKVAAPDGSGDERVLAVVPQFADDPDAPNDVMGREQVLDGLAETIAARIIESVEGSGETT